MVLVDSETTKQLEDIIKWQRERDERILQSSVDEYIFNMALYHYNSFVKLCDGDFITIIDYPHKVSDQWGHVSVGMMDYLYSITKN